MTAQRRATGQRAEALAAALLESKGMRVLARNWRRPEGEIDLVVDDHGVCVFVEVRSRTGDERGHALETVTRSKQARVVRSARLYMSEENIACFSAFRFDVVGVTFSIDGDGTAPECLHIEDAFQIG